MHSRSMLRFKCTLCVLLTIGLPVDFTPPALSHRARAGEQPGDHHRREPAL
ncbi:hypothetical protein [Pseudomonas purpurea]|uniref:hypothetical protein n=1 Tax=Pseudomonas purpurea TaxID=3136737 RepID=UPI003267A30A